ncbi:MAG: LD-carboxypeptidase [Chloroflexota bacterium]|nr:LD-carboxypeptidase [Chloroflexota bacterium]
MTKAPMLKRGDMVGIVSSSWGGAGAYPHRLEAGIKGLQALGFRVKVGRHARSQAGFVSDTPEHRAEDIHDMFRDADIKGIVSAIGGDHSCHLLPLLDFSLIERNPKVFIGFSDITVLNVAIWKMSGLVTFNGPAVLTDFAEYPEMPDYTSRYFLKAVCDPRAIGQVQPSNEWTEELLDWEGQKDRERARKGQPNPGWTWLKEGSGAAEGILLGGCLESLQHLRGTRYWPSQDDWQGAILFFETSEDKPSPPTVDAILMDYENMGILERLSGLLVGRPMKYSEQEKKDLHRVLLERTERYSFPIIADMDFGHTSPQMTLPLGCRARISMRDRAFEIVEAGVG